MKSRLTLRSQLLVLVGGPLFLLLLVETVVSYGISAHTANQIFDRWLVDSAYSLSQEVREDENNIHFIADETAIEVFEWDELDDVYFRVAAIDGTLLAGYPEPWTHPDIDALATGPEFTETTIAGRKVRSVSVLSRLDSGSAAIVSVAETLGKRSAITSQLIPEVFFSKAIFLAAVMVLVSIAFDRGIRPLIELNREMANRSSRDLSPIKVTSAPDEVQSLVTSTNQLLSRLDTALTSREQFIGNIAHQIKTPLAGIKLQAQVSRRETRLPQIHTSLDRITGAIDHLTHVNSQLMKLARAESASGRGLEREAIDLAAIAKQVFADLEELAELSEVTLELRAPKQGAVILGDDMLMRELIWNLLQNAIIYGEPGNRVWIHIESLADSVRMTIGDHGPGIARKHWPRIFERFFRPEAVGEGCGLGLAIVQEIAHAHDTEVTLEQPESGPGICFVVNFKSRTNIKQ